MNVPLQKGFIDDVLRLKEFVLIILDACRYDVFEEVYRDWFSGHLYKTWSSGSCTIEWLKNTFEGYYDLVYVSANGFVLSKRDAVTKDGIFSARQHFKKVVDVFLEDWDDKLGTVHPRDVNKRALENVYDRMIIHYIQPHFPAIGETKLLMNEMEIEKAVREGKVSIETVKKAYRDNLRLVLDYVYALVMTLPHDRIFITSDHGEKYIGNHPCRSNEEELRLVPFFMVDFSCDADIVKDRLRRLGYW